MRNLFNSFIYTEFKKKEEKRENRASKNEKSDYSMYNYEQRKKYINNIISKVYLSK